MKLILGAGAAVLTLVPLAAMAQAAPTSTVQIYGRLDLAANVHKLSGASGTRKAVSSDTSLIGFRGTEDLGGGRAAYFKMEHGFMGDTGAAANAGTFWNREVYVGLRDAALGSVELGTHWTPHIFLTGKTDPFGRAQTGAQFTLLQGAGVRGYTVQLANSVAYISPVWGGFQGRAMIQAPEGAVAKNRSFGLEYTKDKLYVGLAYDDANVTGAAVGQPAVASTRSKTLGLGATYNLDVVKLYGYVQQNKVSGLETVNGYQAGISAPVGSGEFRANYSHTDRSTAKASLFAVGYAHHLSRRTQVYTTAAKLDNRGAARFNMWPSSQDFGAAGAPAAGQDVTGFQVGMRHLF